MKNFYIFLGIFFSIAITRFIPHPPNFTSLIALSFYVPAFFGLRSLPIVLASFAITDLFIGLHSTVFFTWGSVLVIGLLSKYLSKTFVSRIIGSIIGALMFYLITNYGVWFLGMYPSNLSGLIQSYIMGIPFFGYSLISTLIFGLFIEAIFKIIRFKSSLIS